MTKQEQHSYIENFNRLLTAIENDDLVLGPDLDRRFANNLHHMVFALDSVNGACPNGDDHACQNGVARFLGINSSVAFDILYIHPATEDFRKKVLEHLRALRDDKLHAAA